MKHQLLNIFLLQLPGVMSFRIFHREYNKTVWNDQDLCKSAFQSTSFDTDYETFLEKKQRTVRMINMAVKLLDHF